MEESSNDFPGFQTCHHKEVLEYRGPLSRLQRRAPCPLQIKPSNASMECKGTAPSPIGCSVNGKSAMAASSFNSFYNSKEPIPLLSPLVLPSLLESAAYIQQGNTAKSH
ncbi:hypothetical protein Tsubulata_017992 [Turnera subulata]|uniref:Uncharacterized protein n=1 Tax=Turnera subulata TaxID=218843 RepID=A0A9Q0F4B3_9ROSI|nr:hypothetical protein Tsubulata_017992 [Turnera subulata]